MINTPPKIISSRVPLMRASTMGAAIGAMSALLSGCLDRPVSPVTPETTNVFVDRISVTTVDKLDLLFLVDNSISMADKQKIMEEAVPQLLNRLVDPICVDAKTKAPLVPTVTHSMGCPPAAEAEFKQVNDIHIGVITSSLGGHGGVTCSEASSTWEPQQNDRGRLITRTLSGHTVNTINVAGGGFLSWNPEDTAKNPQPATGIADRQTLIQDFQNLVTGAGDVGCGYEASLESWYRFLVDPAPYQTIEVRDQQAYPVGLDTQLLEQRAQFLRPDSLVAIIMLTDENDCSIIDFGHGHYAGAASAGAMPRSTAVCEQNPNDPCCMPCNLNRPPASCPPPAADANCQAAMTYEQFQRSLDALNLRCFDQKRRFGIDFLYPTDRYVKALTQQEIMAHDGTIHTNPLFAESAVYPGLVPRMDSSLIFLAGIVGVPWQDIADLPSLNDSKTLRYLSASEISELGIWDDIVGDPQASLPVPPRDPFMLESVAQRAGVDPRTQIPIQQTAAQRPGEGLGVGGNPINGHEYVIGHQADLQYACTFPLPEPVDCTPTGDPPTVPRGCDCGGTATDVLDRPLCDGNLQTHAKAYPSTRVLQVLKDYGSNSIVASICPKNITNVTRSDPDYGYNPAVAAIIDRLKEALTGTCLPRRLVTDAQGNVACRVVEVTHQAAPAPCAEGIPGRRPIEPEIADAVVKEMKRLGMCGERRTPCERFSLCQLTPVEPQAYNECLHKEKGIEAAYGYCYIDMMTDPNGDGEVYCPDDPNDPARECVGNPALVEGCAPSARRMLRFVSPDENKFITADGRPNEVPWPQSTVFVACQGAAI